MADFREFSAAIQKRFAQMGDGLFVVGPPDIPIWDRYLESFPAGTDPIFRKRTEHDCSCCRAFIRAMGAVVAIENGTISTIWDLTGVPEPYQSVANAMAAYVRQHAIRDVFVRSEPRAGQEVSHSMVDGAVRSWNHFFVSVPRRFVTRDGDAVRGEARTLHDVLLRGLTELLDAAVSDVLSLIDQKNLYRGEEHRHAVVAFQRLQERFTVAGTPEARDILVWQEHGSPVARFRNTVIGSLCEDLSKGVEIEDAVKAFEAKVAPTNYKRPKSLITKGMVEQAMATIGELGLETALERRHAKFSDMAVTSVLFVDNSVRGTMRGGILDKLMEEVRPKGSVTKGQTEIEMADFVSAVLPNARSIDLVVGPEHLANFASLTAPVHEDAARLFQWDNNFAWSYEGNAADSIRERVKRAGGRVEGVSLRVSLSWRNTDDLDLHIHGPGNLHIYYGDRQPRGAVQGHLDVDMNVHQLVRDPVENIRWISPPPDGTYRVSVDMFTRRESVDIGFEVEIEHAGAVATLRHDKPMKVGPNQPVADIVVRKGKVEAVVAHIKSGSAEREQWGIKTGRITKVNAVVLSPNHWDDERPSGNRHWFFILDGCRNPQPTRGIYNEFLRPELQKHRKTFEVLADKTKCPPTEDQMSGLGFSSTRKDKVGVSVLTRDGNVRSYAVKF